MNSEIRTRLMDIALQYNAVTYSNISNLSGISKHRPAAEAQRNILGAELAATWAETKSNEQVRNAQLAEVLLADSKYQDALAFIRYLEEQVKANNLRLDCLRFERDCLVAIAEGDSRLEVYEEKEVSNG